MNVGLWLYAFGKNFTFIYLMLQNLPPNSLCLFGFSVSGRYSFVSVFWNCILLIFCANA